MSGSEENSLTTTGQLDWTSLSRSSIAASLDVAARFANAGVDIITVGVGRALGSRFSFPPGGQRELASSLDKMKGVSSWSDALWFGFGIKHVVRALAETEQGAMSVALCAALAHSDRELWDVACILREMCLVVEGLTELIPSIHQWQAFASVCEGSLRRSHFPDVYYHFFRLLVPPDDKSTTSTAEVMAKAILALGALSKQETLNIVFAGTSDCALLAAIAQVLLKLSVEIRDEAGMTLYASQDNAGASALFIRKSTPSRDDGNQLIQKTYYEVNDKILLRGNPTYSSPTQWSSLLLDTFGTSWSAIRQPHLLQSLHGLLRLTQTASLEELGLDKRFFPFFPKPPPVCLQT